MQPRRLAATAFLTVACLVATAGSAGAAPGWQPAVALGAPVEAINQAAVDVAAGGAALAAWDETTGTTTVVRLARHVPGGGFTAPQVVSGNEALPGSAALGAAVAIAADGSGVVAWVLTSGGSSRVRYRAISASGGLGPILDASAAGGGIGYLDVDVNPAGQAAMAWIQAATPYGTTGTVAGGMSTAIPLEAAAYSAYASSVGLDDAGDAVFAWERDIVVGTPHYQVESRVKPAGAGFGAVVVHDGTMDEQFAEYPSLDVAADGRAAIAYGYRVSAGDEQTRYVARNVAGGFAAGTWTPSDAASQPAQVTSSSSNSVAILPDGSLVLVYVDLLGHVWSATRAPGAGFGGYQQLSGTGFYTYALADGGATAAVVYVADTVTDAAINGVVRPAGAGQFGAVREGADRQPFGVTAGVSAGVDDEGNVYALHAVQRCVGQTDPCPGPVYDASVRLVTYDVVPPALTGVQLPAMAAAKRPARFAASASDRVSATTLAWSFGDGSSGVGPSVTHSYKKKGTYTATLTATDAAGNISTRTQKVTVLPPALPSKLSAKFKSGKSSSSVRKLVLKKVLAGSKVVVSCKGGGCPVKSRAYKVQKKGGLSLTALFTRPKVAQLAPKTKLLVEVTAKKATGLFFSFTVGKGQPPMSTAGCLTSKGKQFSC